MPIPKNYPLESFDPRFKDILLRGARGEDFLIPCRSRAEAYRLQHMLNAYRQRAKQHFGDIQPDEWRPLFICAIGIVQKNATYSVHIYSRHKEFEDVLSSIAPSATTVLAHDPLDDIDGEGGAKGG